MSARADAAPVVLRTETGYLRTEVHDRGPAAPAGDRYRWVRRPGVDRPEPFRDTPGGLLDALGAPASEVLRTGAHVAGDQQTGPGRAYDAPSAVSLAAVLTSGHLGAAATHVAAAVATVDAVLRRWESSAPTAPPGLGPVPALGRLDRWLAGRTGPRASSAAAAVVVDRLGERRLEAVRAWCSELAAGRTLVHGGFSSGAVVLPLLGGTALRVLTGEEVAAGPAGLDRGWLVGELDEIEHHLLDPAAGAAGEAVAVVRSARDVLLEPADGRDGVPDLAAVTLRTRAVRVLVHLHDFAAYVGWHDTLLGLVELAADRVDAALGATPPGGGEGTSLPGALPGRR